MKLNKKANAILVSLGAIALAGSVIAGSTYALFTSESKTNVSISAGKVAVTATIDNLAVYSPTSISTAAGNEIVDENNAANVEAKTFANGGSASIEENVLTLDKMTPGDKVTFDIKIHNDSDVAVKYRTILKTLEDTGLFDGLKVIINDEEFADEIIKSQYKSYAVGEDDKTISVSLELPANAGNEYQGVGCKIQFAVEAVQGNADIQQYEVTPENAQEVLDGINGEATVILTEGDYSTLYLRQDLDVSTRRSDLDGFNAAYPGYYREIKDLKIVAKEGATVTCDGIVAEAGLFFWSSAPASNQEAMNRANSGFLSYLSLENVTIEGITFDNTEKTAIYLRDNEASTSSSTILVDGLTVKNCVAKGDSTDLDVHFFDFGSGSNDKLFTGTEKTGYNNIVLAGNKISNYYQPIHSNNNVAVLNGLKVRNNTFTDCVNNTMQLSNKVNKGAFTIKGNTIVNMNGRFFRIASVDSGAKFVFKNNKIVTPTKYNDENAEVVKITGTAGYTVYESGNNWNEGSYSGGAYISMGDTSLLPEGTYSA